jgi:hypothetical protein
MSKRRKYSYQAGVEGDSIEGNVEGDLEVKAQVGK